MWKFRSNRCRNRGDYLYISWIRKPNQRELWQVVELERTEKTIFWISSLPSYMFFERSRYILCFTCQSCLYNLYMYLAGSLMYPFWCECSYSSWPPMTGHVPTACQKATLVIARPNCSGVRGRLCMPCSTMSSTTHCACGPLDGLPTPSTPASPNFDAKSYQSYTRRSACGLACYDCNAEIQAYR